MCSASSHSHMNTRLGSHPADIPLASLNHYGAVVSGGGPAGLSAALELAKQGKRVLIVTNRPIEEFTRVQKVYLDNASKEYLISMLEGDKKTGSPHKLSLEDQEFLANLTHHTTIPINEVEKFILRRLNNLPDPKHKILDNSKISRADLETKAVIINPVDKNDPDKELDPSRGQEFSFDFLIGADGAHHHAANMVNQSCHGKPLITYEEISGPKRPHHATVQFTIERADGARIDIPSDEFITHLGEVNGSDYLWATSLERDDKSGGRKVICTFGGEIPEALYEAMKPPEKNADKAEHEKKKELAITNYLQQVMESYLEKNGLNVGAKLKAELVLSDRPRASPDIPAKPAWCQAFKTNEMRRANKAAVKNFYLIGDAAADPNYQFGHGVNHALQGAKNLGKVIAKEMTNKEYNEKCKSASKKISRLAAFFRSFLGSLRSFRSALAKKVQGKAREMLESKSEIISLTSPYLSEDFIDRTKAKNIYATILAWKTEAVRILLVKGDPISVRKGVDIHAEFKKLLAPACNAKKEVVDFKLARDLLIAALNNPDSPLRKELGDSASELNEYCQKNIKDFPCFEDMKKPLRIR